MALQFALSVVAAIAILYLPSYLLLRATGLQRLASVLFGPLVTVLLYALLATAFSKASIPCTWATLLLPIVVAGAAAYALRVLAGKGSKGSKHNNSSNPSKHSSGMKPSKGTGLAWALPETWGFTPYSMKVKKWHDPAILALYVGIAAIIGAVVFLGSIESLDALNAAYDNLLHLPLLDGYIQTSEFSIFGASKYPTPDAQAITPLIDNPSSFYPTAWHMLGAMTAQVTGASALLTTNVIEYTLAFVVFPASMFALFRQIFWRNPKALLLGAVAVIVLADFPWAFLVFGPLYPNMLAMSIWPALAALFICVFDESKVALQWMRGAILILVGVGALAVSQTNTVFLSVVFLAPYLVYWLARTLRSHGKSMAVTVAACVAFCAFVALVWYALFMVLVNGTSMMYEGWVSKMKKMDAIVGVLTFDLEITTAQIVPACLVILGIVYAFIERRYLWLVGSYLFAAVIYVSSAAVRDLFLHFLIAGFWYSDYYRTAANVAVVAMPLMALGLLLVVKVCRKAIRAMGAESSIDAATNGVSAVLIVAVCVAVFGPTVWSPDKGSLDTPFQQIAAGLRGTYSSEQGAIYTQEEMDFVERAIEAVPEGALIINQPNDGSAFAAGAQRANLYYRDSRHYGGDNEKEESAIIRESLKDYATSEEVREAVEAAGAQYLLLLDVEEYRTDGLSPYLFTYNPEEWEGIDGVDDETPGFEVVLAEDDMRLYKIGD